EDAPALARGDETHHARRAVSAPGDDDDVCDAPDRRSARIEQRQAHHPECVDEIACHRENATDDGPRGMDSRASLGALVGNRPDLRLAALGMDPGLRDVMELIP